MGLKEIRIREGLTRQQLADATGFSIRTIESWEQGRRKVWRKDKIEKLAQALGVDPNELKEI